MLKKLPTISIITCSYNSDLEIYEQMLKAITFQDYPKDKIEHIVMEGGSSNGSIQLAQKYKTKVNIRKDLLNFPLRRMKKGIIQAKGDLLLFLEPDNIVIGKDWLKKMVQPFIDNPKVIGTFSIANQTSKKLPLLTRYSALIGVNDPIVYYLGKSEKIPLWKQKYDLGKYLNSHVGYQTREFDKNSLPTLGDNGHMVRTTPFLKVVRATKEYYHTDAFMDLLEKGWSQYGVVNNSIIHHTGSNIITYFSKRVAYKKKYYDKGGDSRTYLVFNPKKISDVIKIILFIISTIAILPHLIFSIRGFIIKRDIAWFLHPIACYFALVYYSKAQIEYFLFSKRRT